MRMSLVPGHGPITPPSLARCEELAKLFQEDFPESSPHRCRSVVAALLFFPSWEAAWEAARDGWSGQPRDQVLTAEALQERIAAQREILCQKIGQFDGKNPPSLLERRSFTLLAQEVLREHSPSGDPPAENPAASKLPVRITLSDAPWLESFPQRLSSWWLQDHSGDIRVGNYLQTQRINASSTASIVRFSRFWGAVCSRFGKDLPGTLLVGTAYLLAEHFAAVHLGRNAGFVQAAQAAAQKISLREGHVAMYPFCREQRRLVQDFLGSYPRDDLAEIFSSRPGVFLHAAHRVMKSLGEATARPALLRRS